MTLLAGCDAARDGARVARETNDDDERWSAGERYFMSCESRYVDPLIFSQHFKRMSNFRWLVHFVLFCLLLFLSRASHSNISKQRRQFFLGIVALGLNSDKSDIFSPPALLVGDEWFSIGHLRNSREPQLLSLFSARQPRPACRIAHCIWYFTMDFIDSRVLRLYFEFFGNSEAKYRSQSPCVCVCVCADPSAFITTAITPRDMPNKRIETPFAFDRRTSADAPIRSFACSEYIFRSLKRKIDYSKYTYNTSIFAGIFFRRCQRTSELIPTRLDLSSDSRRSVFLSRRVNK